MAGLIGFGDSKWAIRIIAMTAVLLLSVINVAGVKWVVKLQFMLLIILLLAGLDFMVGSFVNTDTGKLLLFNGLKENGRFSCTYLLDTLTSSICL